MPPLSELCRVRLIICTAVCKASPQNALGRLVVDSIHRTLSHNVLLYRSTTPLDVRFCGVVSSLLILFSTQNSVNQLLIYSPPLSVLRHFSFKPVWVMIKAWKFPKTTNTSVLSFSKYAQHFLEQSSMKVVKCTLISRHSTLVRVSELKWCCIPWRTMY